MHHDAMNTAHDGLWRAVSHRDASADGLFVYAVTSTKIFCRPSCPSRKPRRDRVEFFPTPAMAESRGYRACRRCRPLDAAAAAAPAADRVRRACEAVARRPEARWANASLSRVSGASVPQLQRAFRGLLGVSPREYVAACRHRRFLDTLRNGHRVTDAIYEAGYGSPSRVYGAIRLPGMTPATYGRGGAGARIAWTTTSSPVGRILVAATARGLCFVEVGRADASLRDALRREFPRAEIAEHSSKALAPFALAARAVAEANTVPDTVPLDIRGTAFQWRVWRALTRIPRGETRSYAAVAAAIGQPKAVRAVARACATNPIALVVPCHRVVGSDGTTGGYRWGSGTKRSLLRIETGRSST
jgi:AraC family transcriptional regulator of adaptative response/methylated-DNA-[protein]-cysteine methyltransferase